MQLLYVDDSILVGYDENVINMLTNDLGIQFAMKYLGLAKQILEMRIIHNKNNKKVCLSQEKYIEKVLNRFNMKDSKLVNKPLASHFKINVDLCPCDDKKKE